MPTTPDVTTPTTADTFDPIASPYKSVVRITDTIGGNRFQDTGVLISPDEVLTADRNCSPISVDIAMCRNG